MAFKLPFKKRGDEFSQVPESNIPVSQVLNMRAQGMNNNQVANQLRAQGFSLNQIRDAMAQADIKGAVMPQMQQQGMPMQQDMNFSPDMQNMAPGGMDQFQQMPDMGGMPDFGNDQMGGFENESLQDMGMDDMSGFPGMPEVQASPDFGNMGGFEQVPEMPPVPDAPPMMYPQGAPQAPQSSIYSGRNDELVDELQRIIETLIEEKWGAVEQKMGELEAWKTHVDEQVSALDANVSEMDNRIDGFAKTVAEKAEGYKDTVEDVSTQMIAIEKMMGKLVPSLAEEIKELRNVVGKMKKK